MTKIPHNNTKKNKRPTLSACLIVKNEEKFLPQCLESIKHAVDEIIIVDTGSTDSTVEIAESFGAKVYHHPWRNNFSEARNHSLNYATCDWIFQIDADEVLEQEDIPLLHKTINTDTCNAFYIAIYSELPEGISKHYFTRLYRRGTAHYEGIVHNQLVHEGKSLPSEIRIYHYGYNLPQDDMQKKLKRTGDLLRQQLEKDPDDIFALTNLVRTYRNENKYDEVIKLAEKGLKLTESKGDTATRNHRQRLLLDLALAFLHNGQLDKTEEICRKAYRERPDFLDNLFLLGDVLSRKGAFKEAIDFYKQFLAIKEKERRTPEFNLLIVDTYEYEHKVFNNIGDCYKSLGQMKEAEIAHKKAIEIYDKEPLCYSSLARLHISQHRLDDAEETLNTAVNLGIADHLTYLLLGDIQSQKKNITEAIHAFRMAIEKDTRNITAHTCLINLLLQTNQQKEAEERLRTIRQHNPDHSGLAFLDAKVKFKNGDRQSAVQFIRNVLQSDIKDMSLYLDIGSFCIDLKEYRMAIEILEKYLTATNTKDVRVLAYIATCYARLGELDSARIGYREALKIDPYYDYATQNLAALEKQGENIPASN